MLSSDDDDQEISSSDIDGSDFEESRNKEREKKRKLQEKEGGKPNKKSRKGAEEEESHDEEEDEEEDASDASAEVSEIEEDDEEEENVVSKGKGKPFKSKDGTTVVRQVVKAPTTGLGELHSPSLPPFPSLTVSISLGPTTFSLVSTSSPRWSGLQEHPRIPRGSHEAWPQRSGVVWASLSSLPPPSLELAS